MDESTSSKIAIRIGKKRLNSAQLNLQRAIAMEGGDELLHGQVEEALDHIRQARSIVDFVMLSLGMTLEDGTQ